MLYYSYSYCRPPGARGLELKLITLTTDFGLQDGYPGIMKGVIWGIAAQVQIVDLTHAIHAQDIRAGALALGRAAPYFPEGTIHLAVVDPEVGTQRRGMAAQIGGCFFVGPDNGLCTALLEQAAAKGEAVQAVQLDQPRFWLAEVSRTFHGRDIFAPVAAHLANGVALGALGSPLAEVVRLAMPQPTPLAVGQAWQGQVIHVDAFGNLATNFTRADVAEGGKVCLRIAGEQIDGLLNTFGEGQPGQLVAILDSAGQVSVCVVNGSAARRLNAAAGEAVELSWQVGPV